MAAHELEDPMLRQLERSTIAQTLKAARASLAEPSRPFTPYDNDRHLFQQGDSSSSRPTSSYSVDQLAFVRDTYGTRPESARSSRSSRFEPIAEDYLDEGVYRREAGADILRVHDLNEADGASSGSEELTPVTVSGSVGAPAPPARTPARPPRPPIGAGGYPQISSGLRQSGGYPPEAPASPAHTRESHGSRERRRSGSRKKEKAVSEESPKSRKAGDASPSRRHKTSQSPTPKGNSTAQAWDAEFEALIGKLQRLAENEASTGALELTERVWSLVSALKAGSAGTARPERAAGKLLRAVLGLMDLKDTKCLFKLSRCALNLLQMEGAINGVHSTGVQAAYLNVAKVLFKCSKSDGHDSDFLQEDLIAPLLEVLQSASPECANNDLRVYIVGVLKNISNDDANQKYLFQNGAIATLFALTGIDQLTGNSKEAQLLIQITATLRNLATLQDKEEAKSQKVHRHFLLDDRLSALTRMMALFPSQIELLTNISRILAKLTLHNSACEALAKNDAHIRQISRTMSACSESAPLTLRLGFVLGNLTARSDRVRIIFSFDCEGTTLVPQLLRRYWQKDRQLAQLELEKGKASGVQEVEEVLVKLVRLLANIAISSSAGAVLAASSAVVDPLLDMLGAKRIVDSEELVLNVVSAVTNLLFYDMPSNLLTQDENKQLLCRLFRPLLLESYNDEALQETARALGNLSRHEDARQCIRELRLDEIIVILLSHHERDLVYYVCGALVNFASDPECVTRLTTVCPVVEKLGKLLLDAEEVEDAALQLVAVKVLTNLSIHPSVQWSAEDIECLRSSLGCIVSIPAASGEDEDADRPRMLELARLLLANLDVAAPHTEGAALQPQCVVISNEAPTRREDGVFLCQVQGCGRRFKTQEKLAEHLQRRHAADAG